MRVYLELLRLPGTASFALAGFVGRFPIAMRSVGCLLMVVSFTGSYSLAGGVAAALVLSQAVTAPLMGKLIDRYGQSLVISISLMFHTVGILCLVLFAQQASPWTLHVAALLAGATVVPVGALVRARWSHSAAEPRLPSAYALEGVLDEAIYVLGPMLATFLAVSVAPSAGLLCALGLYMIGGVWLSLQRRTQPPPQAAAQKSGDRRILRMWMLILMIAYLLVGAFFGALDVALIAFATECGSPQFAGVLLGLLATGSLVSGVVYGTVRWRMGADRRFLFATMWLALVTVPLALASSMAAVAVLTIIAGLSVAPILISANSLVATAVPRESLAQGLTWLSSAVTLGMAAGPAIAGAAVDRFSSHAALLLSSGCAMCSFLVTLAGSRPLSRTRPAIEFTA